MQRRWRYLPGAAALMASGVAAAIPAPVTTPALDVPVKEVTVFSDRARVVRRAEVKLEPGTQTVRLPLLPATIDPQSVRLDASGAKVLRVEVSRAEEGEFPRGEAEALLRRLEELGDEAAAIRDAIDSWEGERRYLFSVKPAATPNADAMHPPLLLDPGGWKLSLGFFETREANVDSAVLPLEQQLRDKQKEIDQAVERVRELCAEGTGQQGYSVRAVIDSKGKADLSLAYVAMNARWFPTYDVRYEPGDAKVELSFSGLVSQETGEDWNDAKLLLSTAIPASTATLPKLAVWKIGDRERFIPTPVPEWEGPPRPLPPMPWAQPVTARPPMSDDELRNALQIAADEAEAGKQVGAPPRPRNEPAYAPKPQQPSRRPSAGAAMPRPPPPPPAPKRSAPMNAPSAPRPSAPVLEKDDMEAPMAMPETMSEGGSSRFSMSGRSVPTDAVGFGHPRGWEPPYFSPDLPAALAGGYDYVYPSAKVETVRTGRDARRVALFSRKFPADANLRVVPALSKQAFLVADVVNDGDRPLLKGQAHLFVGADLVGDAVVPTTGVGEKVTLPLGVDDAVRVERNVNVLSSQRGVFSKQDVSAYEVVIEVMNPRQRAVKCVVVDQVPLKQGEDVEITLDSTTPQATQDKVNGLLEWKFDLASGARQVVKFQYSIARPKDAKLTQSAAPTGSSP